MQAIILAAGESSRFWPLSEGMHKSMIKIMGKPLIEWTIESVAEAGVKEIIIIQSPDGNLEKELGDGKKLGVEMKYVVQPEAKGMGNAVMCAENLIREDFFVLGPTHISAGELIKQMLEKKKETGASMVVSASTTDRPWTYGILTLGGDRTFSITEKPEKGKEPSDKKILSVYLLPKKFFEYYRRVPEHTYSYEDALNMFMKENDVRTIFLDKEEPSLKYPWDLFGMTKAIMDSKLRETYIAPTAKIGKNVVIEGNVWIGENSRIFENSVIKGPCYIGNNCVIGNSSLIRNYSDLEEKVMAGANIEMVSSIVQDGTHLHSGFVGYSIIGKGCRIAAGTIIADRRIDRAEIKPIMKGKTTETGMSYLGAVIGHGTKTGIFASFMPGVLVGSNCIIGSNTNVSENLESDTTFYTKFEKVVKKRGGVGE